MALAEAVQETLADFGLVAVLEEDFFILGAGDAPLLVALVAFGLGHQGGLAHAGGLDGSLRDDQGHGQCCDSETQLQTPIMAQSTPPRKATRKKPVHGEAVS